ncbi:MAG TPA: UDP-3-O-(3-hydroxymyristoyl)glucosamine N-acyltransferase [Nocardioidaceae bacterium]|nr:UDP-3-O-(3-hydroxymyristoyl)glucosamine N-acyltransferase [Nocardioidaceae bacterium]
MGEPTATTFADVARFLSAESTDPTVVEGVSTASNPRPRTLSFVTRWDSQAEDVVRRNPATLFVVPLEAPPATNVVPVPNPRLGFALAAREFLAAVSEATIAPTAEIADTAEIAEGVSIGAFTVVEDGVTIGAGTSIDSHVVLKSGTRVGREVRIGSHTAIGGPGFGFEVDDAGVPIRLAHLGGVVIGDHVEIGAQVSIAQGTIEPTRIEDHVKIDDCVFIAHNAVIGEASFVIAGAEISGSVRIGKRAWISPEASVINKASIGDDALVGIGAVVVGDVEENTVVAGVPAKPRGPRHTDKTR